MQYFKKYDSITNINQSENNAKTDIHLKYYIKHTMKQNIHPKYYPKANVRCACGNAFFVGATKEFIETEVCAKCHPFYTKQEKVMDTLGRVQKYKERAAKKSTAVKRTKNPRARKST